MGWLVGVTCESFGVDHDWHGMAWVARVAEGEGKGGWFSFVMRFSYLKPTRYPFKVCWICTVALNLNTLE